MRRDGGGMVEGVKVLQGSVGIQGYIGVYTRVRGHKYSPMLHVNLAGKGSRLLSGILYVYHRRAIASIKHLRSSQLPLTKRFFLLHPFPGLPDPQLKDTERLVCFESIGRIERSRQLSLGEYKVMALSFLHLPF